MKYPRLAMRVFNTPLLIDPAKGEIIAGILRTGMIRRAADDDAPSVDTRQGIERAGSLAVVNINGSLVHKSSGMDAESGLRSYLSIAGDIGFALADRSVKGILLRIDSPGGEVAGAFDLADLIHTARQYKPVWAIAEDNALSAGYLLASQAQRLLVSQTGLVGSIGVIMMHFDQSKADKEEGIVVTTLYRGKHKADFSPHAPLSDEARTWAEEHLDRRYEQFVTAVARGRGIAERNIRDTEASIIDGRVGVTIGLADDVQSFQQVISEFSAIVTGRSRSSIAVASASANSRNKEGISVPDEHEQADAPVPDLNQIRITARCDALTEAVEIAAFCDVAGVPKLTADSLQLLLDGKPKLQIIDGLRKRKAEASASDDETIHSTITADDGARVGRDQRYSGTQEKPAKSLAQIMRERYPQERRQ